MDFDEEAREWLRAQGFYSEDPRYGPDGEPNEPLGEFHTMRLSALLRRAVEEAVKGERERAKWEVTAYEDAFRHTFQNFCGGCGAKDDGEATECFKHPEGRKRDQCGYCGLDLRMGVHAAAIRAAVARDRRERVARRPAKPRKGRRVR